MAFPDANGKCRLELSASDGDKTPQTVSRTLPTNAWIFVCIEYSLDTNLYLITNVNGSGSTYYDSIKIDAPKNIALTEECWGFNGNCGNKYYKNIVIAVVSSYMMTLQSGMILYPVASLIIIFQKAPQRQR